MMNEQQDRPRAAEQADEAGALDALLEVARQARLIVGGGLAAGVVAIALSYLVRPTFSSSTVLLPPQQQQSMATSALSSLGALAGLAGGAGVRTQLDQYVSLILSRTIADRMIERFKLHEVYDEPLRVDVRKKFWINAHVGAGRRDGLITIEIDDHDPKRATEMATAMVEEFRRLSSEIAISEAQQRKVFFEKHLTDTRDRLTAAQQALQDSGFTPGALKAEPKAGCRRLCAAQGRGDGGAGEAAGLAQQPHGQCARSATPAGGIGRAQRAVACCRRQHHGRGQ